MWINDFNYKSRPFRNFKGVQSEFEGLLKITNYEADADRYKKEGLETQANAAIAYNASLPLTKINPKEIADCLLASDYVESILVLGKDSKDWGQALVAIVVPKEGLNQQVLINSMNQHLKQTLANHKLPKAYLFVEELPILENGKRDNALMMKLLDSVNV